MIKIPISVLELATVNKDSNFKTAIDDSMKIAELVDELNYKRIWFAEHHNMPNIASSATSLLIQLAALKTKNIRVGSGGIMLPNHSPLIIAEQFGTLETLFPKRIDLGLGRAPGTDQITAQALRRSELQNPLNFPSDVRELQSYFKKDTQESKVNAYPGKGLDIPIYILGSSTSSAHIAAELGLPYAFATHFAPAQFELAKKIYINNFRPSQQLEKPHLIACVNVIAADTTEKAQFISTSFFNMIINMVTNVRTGLSKPGEISALINHPQIKSAVESFTACTFIGDKENINKNINQFICDFEINELMVTTYAFDIEDKLNSYRILAELMQNQNNN